MEGKEMIEEKVVEDLQIRRKRECDGIDWR